MSNLNDWARRWNVAPGALVELRNMLTPIEVKTVVDDSVTGEAGAQNAIRLEASKRGVLLFRNNVGACTDDKGNFIRYGLANDSKRMNQAVKSSDLIGIDSNGQFWAIEVKAPGWKYSGSERERAQLKFIKMVLARGGRACFATGPGDLWQD